MRVLCSGFRMRDSGVGLRCLGFKVQNLGSGSAFRLQVLEFRLVSLVRSALSFEHGVWSAGDQVFMPQLHLVPFRNLGRDRPGIEERGVCTLLLRDDLVNVCI